MKSLVHRLQSNRGSALITVIVLVFFMGVLATSMLRYSASERRGNERNRLILRAKNSAENITLYAAEQLTTKLYRLGSTPVMKFPWTGTSLNRVYLPPDNVLDTNFTSHGTVEMRCGILAASGLVLDSDLSSPNYGLQVNTARVPIIAKATASHAAMGSLTAYVQQDMEIALTPLFQFGMFYNMDLELYPSADFTLAGPVHTNGRLMAHSQGTSTATILFTDRVTAAGALYADHNAKIVARVGSGAEDGTTYANGNVTFTHTNGTTTTSLKNSSNLWRDHKYTTSTETTTTINNFKTFATSTYNGNLRTSAHGVAKLELPGIGTYKEQDDPSTPGVDERSNGRQLIEPPNAKKWVWNSGTSTGAWTANTDSADDKESKISWKAGLYIVANPTSAIRSGTLPDATPVYVLPYSYRAFLNTINTATGVHTVNEVVLPGQPTYGYDNGANATAGDGDDRMFHNYLPNRYDTASNAIAGNQVLRIPQAEFGTASSYLIDNTGGYAAGTTVINIDGGWGPISVGETVTIGKYKYLVISALTNATAGSITLARGLREAVLDNAPVSIDQPGSALGTGRDYQINNAAGYVANATTIAVDSGSGTILADNIITINGRKYAVASTSGSPVTSITLRTGLTAAVTDNTLVTIDNPAGTVGTGTSYQLNGAQVAGNSTLLLDTGTGTILPGNIIRFTSTGNTYLVTSALAYESASGSRVTITPDLVANEADNAVLTIDAASNTQGTADGYAINLAAGYAAGSTVLTVDTGAGTFVRGNLVAIGNQQYIVKSASPVAGPHTSITIMPGLATAVVDNDVVFRDPLMGSGYSRQGGTGTAYPADSAAICYPADAYFFDTRRANSNRGVITISGTTALYDRFNVPYNPRPVAKIDFDMTRFKLMVDRSYSAATASTIYDPRAPNTTTGYTFTWANSIFNSAGTRASFNLGITGTSYNTFPGSGSTAAVCRMDPFRLYYAPADPTSTDLFTNPTGLAVAAADLFSATGNSAWYDGIAIYLHSVDAEIRKQTVSGIADRIDSGVRFWNGRGPVISLATSGKTGFTFVTNDPIYTMGHFNADGTINATTTATGNGGYSARYPDVAEEKLCALMGDAYTAISHPLWDNTSSGQTKGWNDAFSALPPTASSSGWRTGANATSTIVGSYDGVYITSGYRPSLLPNTNTPASIGTSSTEKLDAYTTEVSTALLVGIVPTNHAAKQLTDGYVPTWSHTAVGNPAVVGNRVNAGGANNYPRLLENWRPSSPYQSLYIRGSMVAMFESRVAMEPFTNSRAYQAPNRFWGLHQNFRTVNHDLPLEPIVLGSYRKGFRELTPAEYTAQKAIIEALP